jgi:phage terminase large subunit-like protein
MVLEDFRNLPLRMQDLSSVFSNCANLAMKATRLERDGNIIRLKKGLYVVNPKISRAELSPFLYANHIYGPSYVSMQSALRYYGLIPEMVYAVQSMTTGIARDYENSVGLFSYTHVTPEYYSAGITMREESGVSFMIASPEKALCDLMVYTPYLNLRSKLSIIEYLIKDIRMEMSDVLNLNTDILEECATLSRKKIMLKRLIQIIKHERNI